MSVNNQEKRNWRPRLSTSAKKKIGDVLAIWSGVILYGIYKFPIEMLIARGSFDPMWDSFFTSWAPMIIMAIGSSVVIVFRFSGRSQEMAQTGQVSTVVRTPLQASPPVPPPVPVPE